MKLGECSAASVGSVEEATVLIKKYPNRRLYNTSSRAYVNLNDLAALIRQGEEVQVVDAKTGEDLTRVVLTQIIVEDAKDAPTGLPLELLRQLIMASDRAGQEFIMWYLKSAFDTYEKVQDAVQHRLQDVGSAALSPLSLVKNLLTVPPAKSRTMRLEQLRRRVAELEQRRENASHTRETPSGLICRMSKRRIYRSSPESIRGRSPCGRPCSPASILPPGSPSWKAALKSRRGRYWRGEIGKWVGRLVPVEILVPDSAARWRPLVRDAFRFVFERLSARRLAAKVVQQFELAADTAPEQRLLRLINQDARAAEGGTGAGAQPPPGAETAARPRPSWKTACPT